MSDQSCLLSRVSGENTITQEEHRKGDTKLKASEVEEEATEGKRNGEGESVQDVPKPVDFCALDGIWLEEIVRHERHAALGQGGWVFFRPDNVFGLLQYGCPVLDDELQFRIQAAELDVEASFLKEKQ